MGFGCLSRGQIIKGLLYLLFQVAVILYYVIFGWHYVSKLGTLGTVTVQKVYVEGSKFPINVPGDNSMLILLFGVMSLLILVPTAVIWLANIRSAGNVQRDVDDGKKPVNFLVDAKTLLNERFHITLLSVPMISLSVFTVLPIIFMILIAFTNFDKMHQPPAKLFQWVGLSNITEFFGSNPLVTTTFTGILGWTVIWAIFATFTNYLFGMILAMMINKKGIRLKKMWRTIFVITIAIPQFVSLMLMSKMLAKTGVVNVLLLQWGWIDQAIPFLDNAAYARIVVIIINMWVGIPYSMLITTGILMNIPRDLYESAAIDGAGPIKQFTKITLPYMLFVTAPYLITQFVGNINNFNVIFLLTQGGPKSLDYYQAGKTDLLVTWLYKLTVDEQAYNLASTVGIFIFIITGTLSLIVYNRSGSVKREEEFQ
ncbi:MAG: sugar ABC transporter permease [Clostridiales bacterium]|nr:sugar ABC transporter permease [Clostridiales bacterium]